MSMLRSDRPIRKRQADLLDRGALIKAIAKQILADQRPQPPKAITIGLHAEWGAGKSSFLNLLEECLLDANGPADAQEGERTPRPIVLRFNPWLFGSIEQLVRMFFVDLARAVGTKDTPDSRGDANVGDLLVTFGNLVAAASTVFPTGAAELTKLLATGATRMGRRMTQPLSLIEQKAQIDSKLRKLPQPIVVFIDDVDRLEPELTTLFFRMVRLSANFSNVIYVLAFDRSVVERHLAHDSPGFGREYLEKIMQVWYSIPPPHPSIIPCLLKDEMVEVRRTIERGMPDGVPFERRFDADRFAQLFDEIARHFTTVRSVKRYVNGLRLTLPPVAGDVDLVDFFVVELMRLLYPALYDNIRQHKTMVLSSAHDSGEAVSLSGAQKIKELRKGLPRSSIPRHLDDSVTLLVKALFPTLDDETNDRGSESNARIAQVRRTVDRRVCCAHSFDRFFSLSGERTERDEVVGRWGSTGEIVRWFRRTRRRGKIGNLLDTLEKREFEPNEALCVAKAICRSDPRDDLQLADENANYRRLGAIIGKRIAEYGDGNEYRFWLALIGDSDSLTFTVCKVFEEISNLANRIGQQNAKGLQQELVKRIEKDAEGEGFWDGKRWCYLLSAMQRQGGNVSRLVGKRVAPVGEDGSVVSADERLLRFCEVLADVVVGDRMGGRLGERGDEEGIRLWIPDGTQRRLKELEKGGGDNGTRAMAILESGQLW